ncbi:hypothetical protein K456DRAFT_45077 [Colletotrichum gloeosporioides 23]|nr:hypothetical protein K456DRAFT_45077 [Colletotrichum gloeosporioides 23]
MAFSPITPAVQCEVELPCHRDALACKKLFDDCVISVPEVAGSEWFEFRQVEFNLWNRTMKATAQGKSSLDYRLRNHPELRKIICNLLNGLAREIKGLKENGIHGG